MCVITEQPRGAASSSFNGLPLTRPAAADEYKVCTRRSPAPAPAPAPRARLTPLASRSHSHTHPLRTLTELLRSTRPSAMTTAPCDFFRVLKILTSIFSFLFRFLYSLCTTVYRNLSMKTATPCKGSVRPSRAPASTRSRGERSRRKTRP